MQVSEAILKQFALRHSLTANASINRGDVEIINMHTEGGGEQVLELFMRVSKDPVSKDRDRQITASKSRW